MSDQTPAEPTPAAETPPAAVPPAKPVSKRLPSGFTTLRDVATFLVGMVIIIHEVFLSKDVDPAAVAIGVTMTGLPLVFGADERRRAASEDKK